MIKESPLAQGFLSILDASGRDAGGMREVGVQVPHPPIMQDNIPISRSVFNYLCRIPLAI